MSKTSSVSRNSSISRGGDSIERSMQADRWRVTMKPWEHSNFAASENPPFVLSKQAERADLCTAK
ncbi:hypothetical protein [Paraburkholderia sp. C35]|uniref:hypothetical protein n=1 Tax=Paraburkholderia sp. C35 TaxID=2126993 RepID=UPI0013A5A1A1|nr:hypothetical protein [Paraburkholderia sp. C35]